MLISFRVENYRSLRDECELSLVVPSWVDPGEHQVCPLPGVPNVRVGTVAGIYGANASGKSNVLDALWDMSVAVVDSHQGWKPGRGVRRSPFFTAESRAKPSMFEVDFLLDGERITYGFRCDSRSFIDEWLYSYPKNRRRIFFERNESSSGRRFRFGKTLQGRTGALAELTRDNSLFLSAAAANNHPQLTPIAEWFDEPIRRATPANHLERTHETILMLEDEGKRKKVRELLSFADLGVTDLRVTTAELPDGIRSRAAKIFFAAMGSEEFDSETMDRIMREPNRGIQLIHQVGDNGETVPLDFTQESLGTQNWLALIGPMLETLEYGSVLLVDEIDASLHPRLSNELIRVFHDCEFNRNAAQLIFNTHDPSFLGTFLGDSSLRRDEVWLTEKDKCGVTHLYPLTDFRPRKAENLERGYLQGRYGGVPFVDHEHLAEAITGSARR